MAKEKGSAKRVGCVCVWMKELSTVVHGGDDQAHLAIFVSEGDRSALSRVAVVKRLDWSNETQYKSTTKQTKKNQRERERKGQTERVRQQQEEKNLAKGNNTK